MWTSIPKSCNYVIFFIFKNTVSWPENDSFLKFWQKNVFACNFVNTADTEILIAYNDRSLSYYIKDIYQDNIFY